MSWICRNCETENSDTLDVCEVCEYPRIQDNRNKDHKTMLTCLVLLFFLLCSAICCAIYFNHSNLGAYMSERDTTIVHDTIILKDTIYIFDSKSGLNMNLFQCKEYKTYHNDRFNFTIKYPGFMRRELHPENGDGACFTFKNIILTAAGHYNVNNMTPDEVVDEIHKDALYKKTGRDYYIVSSKSNGIIHYEKSILKDDVWVSFFVDYPKEDQETVDPLIKHIMDTKI